MPFDNHLPARRPPDELISQVAGQRVARRRRRRTLAAAGIIAMVAGLHVGAAAATSGGKTCRPAAGTQLQLTPNAHAPYAATTPDELARVRSAARHNDAASLDAMLDGGAAILVSAGARAKVLPDGTSTDRRKVMIMHDPSRNLAGVALWVDATWISC